MTKHLGEHPERLWKWVRAEKRAAAVDCAQFMGDRLEHLAKDLVQFLAENDEPLRVSLGELRVLSGGSTEATKAFVVQSLVASGTHAAASTNQDASLPTALPSVVSPVVESALVLSSHAMSPSASSPVVRGVAVSYSNIDARPSVNAGLVEVTTDSVLNLRLLVQPNAPADQPDLFVFTPGKANAKRMAAPSGKSPWTRKKPAPVFGDVMLKLPPSAGISKKPLHRAQTCLVWQRLQVIDMQSVPFCLAPISLL